MVRPFELGQRCKIQEKVYYVLPKKYGYKSPVSTLDDWFEGRTIEDITTSS